MVSPYLLTPPMLPHSSSLSSHESAPYTTGKWKPWVDFSNKPSPLHLPTCQQRSPYILPPFLVLRGMEGSDLRQICPFFHSAPTLLSYFSNFPSHLLLQLSFPPPPWLTAISTRVFYYFYHSEKKHNTFCSMYFSLLSYTVKFLERLVYIYYLHSSPLIFS